MKNVVLFGSIAVASGLLFVNTYTSLVDAKSWGSDIPNSLVAGREYFKVVNPGNFFRLFSPVNQLLGLLALILFWKTSPSIRFSLGAAFVLYVITEILTFAYFYPRNEIMFNSGSLEDTELLRRTVSEWKQMNWIRSLIILTGLVFSFLSLHKIYSLKPHQQEGSSSIKSRLGSISLQEQRDSLTGTQLP